MAVFHSTKDPKKRSRATITGYGEGTIGRSKGCDVLHFGDGSGTTWASAHTCGACRNWQKSLDVTFSRLQKRRKPDNVIVVTGPGGHEVTVTRSAMNKFRPKQDRTEVSLAVTGFNTCDVKLCCCDTIEN